VQRKTPGEKSWPYLGLQSQLTKRWCSNCFLRRQVPGKRRPPILSKMKDPRSPIVLIWLLYLTCAGIARLLCDQWIIQLTANKEKRIFQIIYYLAGLQGHAMSRNFQTWHNGEILCSLRSYVITVITTKTMTISKPEEVRREQTRADLQY